MKHRHPEVELYVGVAFAVALSHLPLNALPFEIGALGEALHISPGATGLLATLELSAYALTNVIVSPIIHRLAMRRLGLLGAVVSLAATLLTAVSRNFTVFGTARVLAGIGFGCILACASAAGARVRVPERAYAVGMAVSIAFGVLIPQVLAHTAHLIRVGGVALQAHAGVFLGLALLVGLMLPSMLLLPRQVAAEHHLAGPNQPRAPRTPGALAVLSMLAFSIGAFSLYAFIERKGQLLGMSGIEIGNMISVAMGVGFFGTVASTWLGRRFGLPATLIAGLVIEAAAILGTAFGSNPTALWIATSLYLVAWYFVFPYLMGLAASLDPYGRLATAAGAAYLIGGSAAAPIGGYLIEAGGYPAVGGASAGLVLLSATLVGIVSRLRHAHAALTQAPAG